MTELYTITCFFKQHTGNVQLMFQSKATFDAVSQELSLENVYPCTVSDDFGLAAVLDMRDIAAVVRSHVNEYLNGQREAQLLQARAQAMTQRAAQNDPMLKVASMMPGGGFIGGGNN